MNAYDRIVNMLQKGEVPIYAVFGSPSLPQLIESEYQEMQEDGYEQDEPSEIVPIDKQGVLLPFEHASTWLRAIRLGLGVRTCHPFVVWTDRRVFFPYRKRRSSNNWEIWTRIGWIPLSPTAYKPAMKG